MQLAGRHGTPVLQTVSQWFGRFRVQVDLGVEAAVATVGVFSSYCLGCHRVVWVQGRPGGSWAQLGGPGWLLAGVRSIHGVKVRGVGVC
jgi:hypothetical protein